jgi:hypothetical protein
MIDRNTIDDRERLTKFEDFLTFGIIGGSLGERDKRSSSSLSFVVVDLITIFLLFAILS